MKIQYIAAECKPFSKTGGVGDVAGEFPVALKNLETETDIEIITPLYGKIDSKHIGKRTKEYQISFHGKQETVHIFLGDLNGVPVNFVKNTTYFEGQYSEPYINSTEIAFYDDILRFSFFSEACLHLIKDKNPDIVHVNDWVLCYLIGRMAIEKMSQKRVLTVHNIGYQGNIGNETIRGWEIEKLLSNAIIGKLFIDPRPEWNSVNALRLGLELADKANTVSPNYCKEITEPEDQSRYFEGGKGLNEVAKRLYRKSKLIGILNGFEYSFEPTKAKFSETLQKKAEMKAMLSKEFTNPEGFLLGFVGRAVEQKFKLLTERIDGKSVLHHLLDIPDINIAILATGLPEYEKFLREFVERSNYSVTIAFDKDKAKQISLGSDVFLMPSLFEPCGITQMESLSNATPPLVRWTGGLVDTVKPHTSPNGTGFGFDGRSRDEVLRNLIKNVSESLLLYTNNRTAFRELQRRGFNERFSWSDAARKYYEEIYKPLLNKNEGT